MNKTLLYFCLLCINSLLMKAQICNPAGNIVIFSNYDGGTLNINVDENIPNLKIGICSFEAVDIKITGTYANNVTAVHYAGYNELSSSCSQNIPTSKVSGVPANIFTSAFLPSVGYNNPSGYTNMICNYSCGTGSQGGCNTADQSVYYFVKAFGGIFRSHRLQYGCWTNTYTISSGGNCCYVPTSLGVVTAQPQIKTTLLFPNPADEELNLVFSSNTTIHNVEIYNMIGAKVSSVSFPATTENGKIDLKNLVAGIYFVKLTEGESTIIEKIVVR